MTFDKNLTYGMIQEVGEKDVLVNVHDQLLEIELTDDVREAVFHYVEIGMYMIPIDLENKRIVLTEKSNAVFEMVHDGL
jgi:hypothetical protein